MDIVFGASIIASFVAGMVALFAPCCITILLPSYLASIFREKRHMLLMTFVFFSGIAAVLIPIGLGAAFLAQLFRSFHAEMYLVGGGLMILLGIMSFAGRGIAMFPAQNHARLASGGRDAKSIFLLGVFSGAATSCCAPVMAGAVTLAVISGVFWKALIVTFSYVFGMTFPLFIAAYLYDKFHIEESAFMRGTTIQLRFFGRPFAVQSTNLIASALFVGMGALLWYLALYGDAFFAPSYQAAIGSALNLWSRNLLSALSRIPDAAWGAVIIGVFLFFAIAVRNRLSKH